MFNFTTQTVFNSVVLATETQVRNHTAPAGYNVITSTGSNGPELRIGNTRFNQANVLDIQIKKHTVENLASVSFDLSDLQTSSTVDDGNGGTTTVTEFVPGNYRIVLNIGLSMNSQDSFYANPFVYKGKPFFIEFPIKSASESATTVGDRIVNIANKYMLFTAQEKILNVTNTSGEVKFEGTNGYQQITKAVLQKYEENAKTFDCCTYLGDFVDKIIGVPATWTTDSSGVVTTDNKTIDGNSARAIASNETPIAPGIEAFGDYNWMIHNLRLPTLANTYFWSANKSEMPVVGGNYTQFIIRMKADRDGVAGQVVGQRATSVTTHVLYVLDQGSNVSTITTKLTALATPDTDADTVLVDPFRDLND